MSTKASSTRLAETKGKTASVDQETHDDLGYNTDSELAESDQAKQQPPPRKRQRATTSSTKGVVRKKHVRGKLGGLAGLVNMPIDIFTEIASHLLPGDIVSLARSNKFFRNLLMHRSAMHIWHGAMRNVPGLPACPPGMSEPHYLSLLFSKTCSMCGGVARGRMDPVLLVRLCGPCRNANLVSLDDLPVALMSLISRSATSAPATKRRSAGLFVLREEFTRVLAEYEEKKQSTSTLDAWNKERKEIVEKRRKQAQELTSFLLACELDRETELENAKTARLSEIKRRLTKKGWSEKEMEFGWWSSKQRDWNALVFQPKPLTDRIWANIQPKLISFLETNREERLRVERDARKTSRWARLSELLMGIKTQNASKLRFEVQRQAPSSSGPKTTTTVILQAPFPDFTCTLEWPVVKNLYETDSTAMEMKVKFEEHQEEIEALITEWQNKIQSHFANLVRDGSEVQGAILQPTTIVCANDSDPFADMSDDLKLLLRADTLFYKPSLPLSLKRPLTYDTVIRTEGLMGRYNALSTGITTASTTPKLDHMRFYTEAQEIARSLLADMGKPGASYVEMKGVGTDFTCGRCHVAEPKTWEELVQHYIEQKQLFDNIQQRASSSSHVGITYNNVHDPELYTDRPMVKYYSTTVSQEGGLGTGSRQVCQLCEKLPGANKVIGSKPDILAHLRDVHGVAEPKVDEHYAAQKLFNPGFWIGDYDSDDSYYGCDCGNHGRFGSLDSYDEEEDWW
ncbi:unnamed protein product [Rhizoctonia solani]|uniref:F-box domain-containing protein n=3 Tax=Rhizoctonia solani TaxID=456999 RepID=A0A8H3BWW4_9AGAM|nr:hypothetical protein RSOL_321120 [Rhizoctonia solani AG-3 Rhs1AP]KEP47334.1 hypothetical protein V565_159450 [Rhizoctonia solani 123E]CAE6467598.1 unnamed protein product [Rhizoctonia solani]CAE6506408.1 unnamed protein product [Rhizoctonia solani]